MRRIHRRPLGGAVVSFALCASLVGVALSPGTAVARKAGSIPAPTGLPSFYSVPKPLPKGPAGTLIKSQVVSSSSSGLTGATEYRVMYKSIGKKGKLVPVTGLVMVPDGTAPAGGWPVISWGHGTNGMADICAPSLGSANDAVPGASQLVAAGYAVTASDYQGEGTPGLMPYIVGVSAAEDTAFIIEAAHQLPHVSLSPNYVVWGHSEGGQTAMFSLYDQTYLPGLHLRGVVAGAPPSQFSLIYNFLVTSPYDYYLLMVAGSYHYYYGGKAAPLGGKDAIITKAGKQLLPVLDEGCTDVISAAVNKAVAASPGKTFASLVPNNPFANSKWKTLLSENDPGTFTKKTSVPLLIIQGGDDEQIPVVSTQLLQDHECGIGQPVERWVYAGQSHAGVIQPSFDDMLHWIGDRFTSTATVDPYVPTADGADIAITQNTCG